MATEQSVLAVIRASRPSLRNSADKVVFAIHASFLSAGYVLNLTGPAAFADGAINSPSSDEVGLDRWNEFEDAYGFVYSKPEKGSKTVLVKCLVMNEKLMVDSLKQDSSGPLHLEINIRDFVGESDGSNYSSQFKNLDKLVGSVNKEVLEKLDGSSYTKLLSGTPSSKSEGGLRDDRQWENVQPGVHEPSNLLDQSGVVFPPVYPTVGSSDLFPQPGAGMYPPRGDFGIPGNLVGPNDPWFFGKVGGGPRLPGGQPGVPPGARFDPYGPPDIPGFEPGRFPRKPRRPGDGTHPDLEHFGGGSDFI